MSHLKVLLPCELISASHPSEKTKSSFFIFLALFHIARLLSPLPSVLMGSPAAVPQGCCSEPLLTLIAILCHPQISPCAVQSQTQLWEEALTPYRESHCVSPRQRKFCVPLLPIIYSLHLCVQSCLSICTTLCYCLCIAPCFF